LSESESKVREIEKLKKEKMKPKGEARAGIKSLAL